VRVEALPPGARLVLDGLPTSSPMRMARGGRHTLEIQAPGYESRRVEILSDRSQTIPANLRPAARPVP
jgi:hypothetical protein